MDEGTVRKYKTDLTDEIEPQIKELLSRAEKGLKALLKRESTLRAKVDSTEQMKQAVRPVMHTAGMNKLEARRIQMLVRQHERLQEELKALQAEVDTLVRSALVRSWYS